MTLASFRAEPIERHFDIARRAVSYLVKFKHVTIRIRTEETDLFSIPIAPYEWEESVWGKVAELLNQDAPTPKRKHAATVSYHDANLCHNFVTGRSVTIVLHFINKTPMCWHSKTQDAVEIDTYGSECSLARTYVEKILDIRITLKCLWVHIL